MQHFVIASTLNVRQHTAKDELKIGLLPKWTLVEELKSLPDQSWLKVKVKAQAGDIQGWVSNDYLLPKTAFNFLWMERAAGELGVAEIPGKSSDKRVDTYHASLPPPDGKAVHDETAWCSAFANWCLQNSGIKTQPAVNRSARSWMHWGQTCKPTPGCIVVFWRRPEPTDKDSKIQAGWTKDQLIKDGSYGHVAFYCGQAGDRVLVYGGNQSPSTHYSEGEVCKKRYPLDSDNYGVLGYRCAKQ